MRSPLEIVTFTVHSLLRETVSFFPKNAVNIVMIIYIKDSRIYKCNFVFKSSIIIDVELIPFEEKGNTISLYFIIPVH